MGSRRSLGSCSAFGIAGSAASAAMAAVKKATFDDVAEASAAMLKVVETLGDPDTMNELLGIIAKAKEQAGGDEMQEKMAVMGTMLPKIREIMTPTLKEYGFEDTDMGVMAATMSFMTFGATNAAIKDAVSMLMEGLREGKVPTQEQLQHLKEKLAAA